MMEIQSGDVEAMALVIVAMIGLTLGGFLAFGAFLLSALVHRDMSPGTLKGWAIAVLGLIVINVFVFGWLTDLGRQNYQRESQGQPTSEPPLVLVLSVGLINLLAPSMGAMSPIIAFWMNHRSRQE